MTDLFCLVHTQRINQSTAVFIASATGWCSLCVCACHGWGQEGVGMGWWWGCRPVWASLFKHLRSLQTRRLPAGPKTAPAPRFHTPTCHILKLTDAHFADTHAAEHTRTVLYNATCIAKTLLSTGLCGAVPHHSITAPSPHSVRICIKKISEARWGFIHLNCGFNLHLFGLKLPTNVC